MDEIKKSSDYLTKIKNPQSLSSEEKIELSLVAASNAEKESRYDEAIAQLKNLTESWSKTEAKSSSLFEPWLKISKIYNIQKKYDEALKWADKAMGLITVSKNPAKEFGLELVKTSLEYIAELNQQTGNNDKAVQIYKSIIEKYSDDKTPVNSLKYKIGKIYFDQNNIKEAEKIWIDLKQSDKDGLWTKMADENMTQVKWSDKFKRYVIRRPAVQEDRK